MHIMVCLDDRNGMLFNRRRLSSDRAVCSRILKLAADTRLWMNGYSARLFEDQAVLTDEDFLEKAEPGDVCFVENADILPYAEKVSIVTVFCWNRVYPSDVKFPMALLDGWQQIQIGDFPGSSHERITEWRYVR